MKMNPFPVVHPTLSCPGPLMAACSCLRAFAPATCSKISLHRITSWGLIFSFSSSAQSHCLDRSDDPTNAAAFRPCLLFLSTGSLGVRIQDGARPVAGRHSLRSEHIGSPGQPGPAVAVGETLGFQVGRLGGRREGMPAEAVPASQQLLPAFADSHSRPVGGLGDREGEWRVIHQLATWRAWQIGDAV